MPLSHRAVFARAAVLALVCACFMAVAPARAQGDPQAIANRAVVMEVVAQIINGRQLELADQLVAADMVQHLDRPTQGLAGYKAHYKTIFKRFKDYTLEVHHVAAEGDIVAVHGRLHGITHGGNKINFNVADIYLLSGGKLAERWHVRQLINK